MTTERAIGPADRSDARRRAGEAARALLRSGLRAGSPQCTALMVTELRWEGRGPGRARPRACSGGRGPATPDERGRSRGGARCGSRRLRRDGGAADPSCLPRGVRRGALEFALAYCAVRAGRSLYSCSRARRIPGLRRVGSRAEPPSRCALLIAGSFFDPGWQAASGRRARARHLADLHRQRGLEARPGSLRRAPWADHDHRPRRGDRRDRCRRRRGVTRGIAAAAVLRHWPCGGDSGGPTSISSRSVTCGGSSAPRWGPSRTRWRATSTPTFAGVAGIVITAFGLHETLAHVEDPLKTVAAFGLTGGVGIYLGHVVVRLRGAGSLSRRRLFVALACSRRSQSRTRSRSSLGIVIAILCALIIYETISYGEARRFALRLRAGSNTSRGGRLRFREASRGATCDRGDCRRDGDSGRRVGSVGGRDHLDEGFDDPATPNEGSTASESSRSAPSARGTCSYQSRHLEPARPFQAARQAHRPRDEAALAGLGGRAPGEPARGPLRARPGQARRDDRRGLFDYYLGWLADPSVTEHFEPIPDCEVEFARGVGMKVEIRDLRRVVSAAAKRGAASSWAATRSAGRSPPRTRPGTSTASRAPRISPASSTSTAAVTRPR